MRSILWLAILFLVTGCAGGEQYAASSEHTMPAAETAAAFVARAQSELEILDKHETRAYFLNFTDETEDHARNLAEASELATSRRVSLAKSAATFDADAVADDIARKLARIKLAMTLPSPSDPALGSRLAGIVSDITTNYTSSAQCVNQPDCRPKAALYDVFRESRDPVALAEAWSEWRVPGRAIRRPYSELVEIANTGARELGYADVGALWRSHYDMPPEEFLAEYERLWNQIRPLYEALHCHTRAKLRETYRELIPERGLVPAHLFGNMWAQNWTGIDPLVGPGGSVKRLDVTRLLVDKGYTPIKVVRAAEAFFVSLGFKTLPDSFWARSMLAKPDDRKVNCHATAYSIDPPAGDVRMTMCVRVEEGDFLTIHHELGHIYYYLAYADQPFLFRDGANPGFQEAIGDAIALSITPDYLQAIGLLDTTPDSADDLAYLFRTALNTIPDLSWTLLVDMWRWKVYSGEIAPERYTEAEWELHRSYQGMSPPLIRTEDDFDIGMGYQVSFNIPVDRYFIASILQFQIHRSLCKAAGYEGPLHRCSIYGNKTAGSQLASALALGASQPWPDALEALTGSRTFDASAIVDYFAPVMDWLTEQNQNRECGWQ